MNSDKKGAGPYTYVCSGPCKGTIVLEREWVQLYPIQCTDCDALEINGMLERLEASRPPEVGSIRWNLKVGLGYACQGA